MFARVFASSQSSFVGANWAKEEKEVIPRSSVLSRASACPIVLEQDMEKNYIKSLPSVYITQTVPFLYVPFDMCISSYMQTYIAPIFLTFRPPLAASSSSASWPLSVVTFSLPVGLQTSAGVWFQALSINAYTNQVLLLYCLISCSRAWAARTQDAPWIIVSAHLLGVVIAACGPSGIWG